MFKKTFLILIIMITLSCCGRKTAYYSAKDKVTTLSQYYNDQYKQKGMKENTPNNTLLKLTQTENLTYKNKSNIQRPNAIAVIIGNANYKKFQNGIPNVDFAHNDAEAAQKTFIDVLGVNPENIIYVEDATQASLISIFGSSKNFKGKLYNWVKPGKSEIFIYYSGHGAPSLNNKGAYLVPVDANISYISDTGYSIDLLYKNISKIPSTQNIVILDACFSGESGGGTLFQNASPALYKTSSHIKNIKRTYLMSSTSVGELSNWYPEKKHSLFTYYLLDGLNGKADMNLDSRITFGEIQNYVTNEVNYKARRLTGREQHPIFIAKDKNNALVYFK
ncbi:caspase family protein [Maridesulfovibrio bastinii]|uniref:caspase family protein n=1 Tax=Maridesulfovibrio bastinii TaxID=47157 RepID=UPI0003FBEC60|nr:caspase family protein [Maridesulfovibrio bastinii]